MYDDTRSAGYDQFVHIAKLEDCEKLYNNTQNDSDTKRREDILGLKFNKDTELYESDKN